MAVGLGSAYYVQVCHIVDGGIEPTSVTKGDVVGTVFNEASNSHIHINMFYAPNGLSVNDYRAPIPFYDPWRIAGCAYSGNDTSVVPNGHYAGVQVPDSTHCGTPSPTVTVHWGGTSSMWQGINLSRPVRFDVQPYSGGPLTYTTTVTTDGTGSATFSLPGVTSDTYNVYLKPEGFLRDELVGVQLSTNSTAILTFSETRVGTDCNTGQPTGSQIWAGDLNGDNVINGDDYNIILRNFGKPDPTGVYDLDGDGTIDGIDYNIWLRAICFFGGGTGQVVGDFGRSDTSLNLGAAPLQTHTHLASSVSSGSMTLSPSTGSYRVNQTITVAVQADSGGLLLDSADSVIEYNPAILKVTSLVTGTLFPSVLVHANDPVKGEINITGISNSGSPLAISGTLATIQFLVIGSGVTNVTLDFNQNSDAHSEMVQNGTGVQVLGTVNNASYTAGILHVPSDYSTIKQALAAAQSAETVLVAPGTYHEQFTIPAGVTLEGTNPATTIIDGDGIANQPIIYLEDGSTLTGLTVQHSGTDFWDAAVWIDGAGTVTNTSITNASMGIVRFCFSPPCAGSSTITGNIIYNVANTGILVHSATALVQNNTVVNTQLQGITFESTDGQGSAIANIVYGTPTGLTGTSATALSRNLLYSNSTDYASGTTAGNDDIHADPLFINFSANDFRLHTMSPGIDQVGLRGGASSTLTSPVASNIVVNQTAQGVKLSWLGSGVAGFYVSYAQGSNFFSEPKDVGYNHHNTFLPSLLSGPVEFAITSYDSLHNESLPVFAQANIASISLNPLKGVYNTPITITGSYFNPGDLVNIYLDSAANVPITAFSADNTGSFSGTFTIPAGTYGTHSIVAQNISGTIATSTHLRIYETFTLLHTSGVVASQDTANGYGFSANETVNLYWNSTSGQLLGTATTDSLGSSIMNFTIPTAPGGSYKLYLVGQSSKLVITKSFRVYSFLKISPTSGARGSNATVTGNGFGANETVTVRWDCASNTCSSTLPLLGTVTTDSTGSFSLVVTIPQNTSLATHKIGGLGGTSGLFSIAKYTVTS